MKLYLQVKLTPIDFNNQIQGVYAIIKDMSAEHTAKQALIESEERFRLIAENSYDLISLLDDHGKIVYASPSYGYLLGYPVEFFENKLLSEIVFKSDHTLLEQAIRDAVTKQVSFTVDCRIANRLNDWLWFELNGQPVFTRNHQFKHLVIVGRDITDRKKYEERLKVLAYHDSLTELPNRRLFQDRLEQVIATYERKHQPFAIMMLDLDDFKCVNDQMGHDVGDEVMKEFGKRLQQSVREMDTVARLGGDEFIILLPDIESEANVDKIVKRINNAIKEVWSVASFSFYMTTSIGVVIPNTKGFTAHALMKKADQALYQAKNNGKNESVLMICDQV